MRVFIAKRAIRSAAAMIHSQDIAQVFGDDLVDHCDESETNELCELKDKVVKHIERMPVDGVPSKDPSLDVQLGFKTEPYDPNG